MTRIVIDYKNGITVEYTVPDTVSDAIEALIDMYPHTVLEYPHKDQEGKDGE